MAKVHPNHPMLRNPKFAQEVFDSSRRPWSWLNVGRKLRSSADAIFQRENPVAERFWAELNRIGLAAADGSPPEDIDDAEFPFPNFDAAYMLIGFAIENFLKGLAIAKGLVTFESDALPTALKTHDLSKLHKLAAPLATISPHVLASLTYMSEWRARYPLPTSVEKFWPIDDDGSLKIAGFSWPNTHSEFLAYCDGLEGELSGLLNSPSNVEKVG